MANKILLMSHCVPPIARGPSVIINRLFKRFPNDSYVILTSRFDKKAGLELDQKLRLPCRYYYTNGETIVGGYKNNFFSRLRKWLETIPIAMKGTKVVGEEKCCKILVCPTHGNFLLAAWIIHKVCRKPLYVYFFDLFSSGNNDRGFFEPFMRRIAERLSLRSAKCVFVMSEKLKNHYQARYPELNIKIIRHPIDRTEYLSYHSDDDKRCNFNVEPVKIVFTGMIYEYQIDAIQNLAKAVNGLDGVHFHLYTQRSKKYLEDMGVCGKNIFHFGYMANKEIFQVQKNADILFLPMTFGGSGVNYDIVKTASPSKLSEYLASGNPILINAPKDSYIAWYAMEYGFGLVVDSKDIKILRESVTRLITDKCLRDKFVTNAAKVIEMHDVSKVTSDFMNGLGVNYRVETNYS